MSLNDAVWLTATTIVTVGYGDLSAETQAGRIATMALMYAGAIFVVAVAINQWLDIRSERAERKAQGAWSWNLDDHILIIGAPERNQTDFFLRLSRQIRQEEAWHTAPIQLLTPCFESLPQALRELGVVHYAGRGTRQADLVRCDVARARGVIILSDDEADAGSDARTFDIVHRVREAGYAGPIVAECVEDENRRRLRGAGATAVVRPMRGFPEVLTGALFAPGSEQILENLFTSEGDECLLVELAAPCTASWVEIVSRVVGEDLGIPIGCRLPGGRTWTNPPGRQQVTVRQNVLMARFPRLTDTHIRLVHREVVDPGSWPGLEHFTEEQYDEHLSAFLHDRPEGPIGVFAYGSLIWRPAFEPVAVLRALALGWHRAFTLRIKRFRGTPECPGLMMQIDRGGTCEGVLQIVPQDREWAILSDLWRREMTVRPPGNCPTWIEVEVEQEVRRAIAFTANPESQNYAGILSPEEVAACLVEACGHWGTGAEYLLQTITAFEREGIHDPHLWELQERVAELIEARFPEAYGRGLQPEQDRSTQGAG